MGVDYAKNKTAGVFSHAEKPLGDTENHRRKRTSLESFLRMGEKETKRISGILFGSKRGEDAL